MQSPNPAIQGGQVAFNVSLQKQPLENIGGTISAAVVVAGCSVPSCVNSVPTIDIAKTKARSVRARLSMPSLRGRTTYTLEVLYVATDSHLVARAAKDFYVEIPDEQSDSFRNGVDVADDPPPKSFCDKTNYGWRFERDDSNHLRAMQPYDQCNGQPRTGWLELGGGPIASSPAIALSDGAPQSLPNRRIHLFYRGADGLLWTRVWDAIPFDNDAASLGGPITSAPAALASPDFHGRVEVFYRGSGSNLVNRSLDAGHSWSSEQVLAAALGSAPAAYSFQNGLDIIVFRGPNKHLWVISRDRRTGDPATRNDRAPWSAAADLGGVELRSSPGISQKSETSRVTVEYRGPDDKVWESSWNGKDWWSAPIDTKTNP